MKTNKKISISIWILLCCLFLTFLGCTQNSISVFWFDAEGNLLETQNVSENYDPLLHPLPTDNHLWHYTEWSISKSGNVTICTAVRVPKTKIVWKDSDGTVLKETFVIEGEKEPDFDLPTSTEHWIYTDWNKETNNGTITYTAEKIPNEEYFQGNVFQIIIKDQKGEPLGSGSGFVINDDGWFITNNHVMEKGYSASAFFDIIDYENGAKYTELKVLGGVYYSADKDIFIGKLENYQKIKSHYHSIEFTTEYSSGDDCYSVGYPNSSVKMEINQGRVTEEYSDIYDKINGIYYLLSDSYIAPGSSGGILVNKGFEVIGITSMGLYSDETHEVYISGGSIPVFVFQSQLNTLNDVDLKSLTLIYGT